MRGLDSGRVRRFVTPALFIVVGGLIFLRAAVLVNPLIVPDEYGYFALSQAYPHPEAYYAHDPRMKQLNNVAFFALGHLLFALSDSPELLLKAVNTLSFLAALLLVGVLMGRVAELPSWRFLWIVALLYPYSCFTVNFMPESLYMLVFWVMTCAITLQAPRRPLIGPLAAGVACSVLFLVKPHAIALVPALVLGSAIAASLSRGSGRWWRGAAAGLVASVSFYVGVVLLFAALGGPLHWSLPRVVSPAYRPYIARMLSLDAGDLGLGARAIGGNLVFLACLFGPAFVAMFWRGKMLALRAWRGHGMSEYDVRRLTTLVFAVTALAGLMAMTTNFTMAMTRAGSLPQLHERHYGFMIPLLLVACVVGADELSSLRPQGLRAMGLGGLAAAAGMWLVSRSFFLYPWDSPTAFAFSTWQGRVIIPSLALAILVTPYLCMLVPIRRWSAVYGWSLCALFLLGHLATFGWQRAWSDVMAERVEVGRAVRAMVPPAELDRGLVVGARRYHAFSAVLFGLRAPAYVLELPRGATLDASRVPTDVAWVAAIGKYDIRLPWRDVVKGPGFVFGRPLVAPGATRQQSLLPVPKP